MSWLQEGGSEGVKSFIGICLIKMGTSGITIWGNVGIYYFSYLKQWEPELTHDKMQVTWSFAAVMLGIISMFSVYLGDRYGYANLVRILCFIYPISLFRSSYCESSSCFNLYQIFFVVLAAGLGLMPVLFCLWSFYSQNSGKATSVALSVYGISAVFYTLYSIYYINPSNEEAITYFNTETKKEEMVFDQDVVKNVPQQIRNLAIIQGIFNIAGAILIRQNNYQINKEAENISNEIVPSKNVEEQLLDKLNQVVQRVSIHQENEALIDEPSLTLKEALFSQPFKIIWITTAIMSLYALYISLNYKVYGLSKINDDHMLTYISVGSVLVGSFLNYFWGIALDNSSYRKVYFAIFISFGFFGVTFPLIPNNLYLFGFWYLALTSIERGLYSIIGPVLIKIFGLKLGSKVFPYKFTSWVAGLIMAPAFSYLLHPYLSMGSQMIILGLSIFLALGISTKLEDKYIWQSTPNY